MTICLNITHDHSTMSPHTQQVPEVKNDPWTECLSAQVLENQPEYILLTTEVTQELLFIS